MKALIFNIIFFISLTSVKAQSFKYAIEATSIKNKELHAKEIMLIKYIGITPSFQFGSLFMSVLEARKAHIYLKDFFNDYDLGVNFNINYSIKKNLDIKTIYNIGLLKFHLNNHKKPTSCIVKIVFNYKF